MINIVIPMAGEGKRFQDAGHTTPKPFIDVKGMPMIERVLQNLAIEGARFILAVRPEHLRAQQEAAQRIREQYAAIFVEVEKLTEGAACTVLLARDYIDNEDGLVIANSDQLVDVSLKDFLKDAESRELDGSLLTFHATHSKWSYARLNEEGLVAEVKEKQLISEHATVGIYYYRHGKDFVKAADAMIAQNERVNNEFYVAPVYNYAIADGKHIGIFEIAEEKMHGLGTPEDMEQFITLF